MCLQIGYPTLASIPHSVINGYKKVLAVAVETDYSFPLADKVTASALLWDGASLPVQVRLQNSCCSAVLSFPLQTASPFPSIPVCALPPAHRDARSRTPSTTQ